MRPGQFHINPVREQRSEAYIKRTNEKVTEEQRELKAKRRRIEDYKIAKELGISISEIN